MSIKPWPFIGLNPPHVRGSDTSRQAADSIKPIAPTLRHKVYQYIMSQGAQGATDDQVSNALDMAHRTATARRRELEQAGAVCRTAMRRPTSSGRSAGVYVAVPGADLSRRQGRPPKAPANALSVKLTVYLTEAQDAQLARVARKQGNTKGETARQLLGMGYTTTTNEAW